MSKLEFNGSTNFPSFNLIVFAEFDTVMERPTWLLKLNGKEVARVIQVSDKEVGPNMWRNLVITEGFEGPPPWKLNGEMQHYETPITAIWATVQNLVMEN